MVTENSEIFSEINRYLSRRTAPDHDEDGAKTNTWPREQTSCSNKELSSCMLRSTKLHSLYFSVMYPIESAVDLN